VYVLRFQLLDAAGGVGSAEPLLARGQLALQAVAFARKRAHAGLCSAHLDAEQMPLLGAGHKLVASFGELTIERGIGRGRGGRRSVGGGAADALLDFAASVSRSRRCKSCQVAARSST